MNLSSARVFVKDLSAAHSFYAQALGLPLRAGGPEAGFCVYAAGNCQLVVESVASDAPVEDQALVGRFTGLSFTVQDIDAQHRRLVSRGVIFTSLPERQPWGGTLATLLDPAGNGLQLVQHPSAA
jgi:predicted enzyme related to lactoylglutathione lyase